MEKMASLAVVLWLIVSFGIAVNIRYRTPGWEGVSSNPRKQALIVIFGGMAVSLVGLGFIWVLLQFYEASSLVRWSALGACAFGALALYGLYGLGLHRKISAKQKRWVAASVAVAGLTAGLVAIEPAERYHAYQADQETQEILAKAGPIDEAAVRWQGTRLAIHFLYGYRHEDVCELLDIRPVDLIELQFGGRPLTQQQLDQLYKFFGLSDGAWGYSLLPGGEAYLITQVS